MSGSAAVGSRPLGFGDRVARSPAALLGEGEEAVEEVQVVVDRLRRAPRLLHRRDIAFDVGAVVAVGRLLRQPLLGFVQDAFVVLNRGGLAFEEVAEVGDVGVADLAQRQALLRRRLHLAHQSPQLLLGLGLRQPLAAAALALRADLPLDLASADRTTSRTRSRDGVQRSRAVGAALRLLPRSIRTTSA